MLATLLQGHNTVIPGVNNKYGVIVIYDETVKAG
jgi:hypothetical protein